MIKLGKKNMGLFEIMTTGKTYDMGLFELMTSKLGNLTPHVNNAIVKTTMAD